MIHRDSIRIDLSNLRNEEIYRRFDRLISFRMYEDFSFECHLHVNEVDHVDQ